MFWRPTLLLFWSLETSTLLNKHRGENSLAHVHATHAVFSAQTRGRAPDHKTFRLVEESILWDFSQLQCPLTPGFPRCMELQFVQAQVCVKVQGEGHQNMTHKGDVNAVGFLPVKHTLLTKCCDFVSGSHLSRRHQEATLQCERLKTELFFKGTVGMSHPPSFTCCLLQPLRELSVNTEGCLR